MDEVSRARIRVFLNDPAARGERPVPSEPPRETERSPWGFRVEGRVPSPRAYEPDTPEFLHWQIAAALERGRALWSRLLPRAGSWVAGPVLPAVPVSGEGLNAYYDRRALHFFRDVDSQTGAVVQTGESPDIVAHEQGHAVLDTIRPDLWDAPHFEVAAFHEGFGDLASILIAFDEPKIVRAVLDETRGALDQSNLVSRVAEELAAAAAARFGPGVALPDALRGAVNSFRYAPPRSLPEDAPPGALSREPHSFCRVLTGACWDILVRLYAASARDAGSADEKARRLTAAAREVARLITAAAERAPSRAGFLVRFAAALAGSADAGSREVVAAALAARGLLPAGKERGEARAAIFPEGNTPPTVFLDRIRDQLGASREEEILLQPSRSNGSLSGRRGRDLFLSGPEYGPADGAAVEISDSFTAMVAESGYVSASRIDRAGPEDEEDARAFAASLAASGRIAAESDGPPDPARLFRQGTSHFVVRERDGVRRVRRAWIAGARYQVSGVRRNRR